jgi:hypothetical protein
VLQEVKAAHLTCFDLSTAPLCIAALEQGATHSRYALTLAHLPRELDSQPPVDDHEQDNEPAEALLASHVRVCQGPAPRVHIAAVIGEGAGGAGCASPYLVCVSHPLCQPCLQCPTRGAVVEVEEEASSVTSSSLYLLLSPHLENTCSNAHLFVAGMPLEKAKQRTMGATCLTLWRRWRRCHCSLRCTPYRGPSSSTSSRTLVRLDCFLFFLV